MQNLYNEIPPMAPPRKVPAGSTTRSVLLRADQVTALDDAAARLGCDLADLLRGMIDLLAPPHPGDEEIRVRAALEVRRREIGDRPEGVRDELVRAILDGWRGEEPRLSLRLAGRAAAKLVSDTVRMVRWLFPTAPKGPRGRGWAEERWGTLGNDWAGSAPLDLLTVLASPATRTLGYRGKASRPELVVVARAAVGRLGGAPAERQYEAVGRAVTDLVANRILMELDVLNATADWPFFAGVGYRVEWKHPSIKGVG
jgi:hypothetical protein